MKIRWYKGGKFTSIENKEDNYCDIKIGDIVRGNDVYYYDYDYDDYPHEPMFTSDMWTKSNIVQPEIVEDIKYIDTKFYKGYIIKIENHWPWFQIKNFIIE